MMVSYEQARGLVRDTLPPTWRDGTFCLDDRQIVEDDELYVFRVGPRELLVDGDLSYARFGGAVACVVKADARLVWVPEVRLIARGDSLRIGPNPSPTFLPDQR